jgi:FkbM family methyltransferase
MTTRLRLLELLIAGKARLKSRAMFGPFDWPLATLSSVIFRLGSFVKRRQTTELRIKLHDGLTMLIPPGSPSSGQFQTGLYETEVTALIRVLLKPGMNVVDLGASSGYYTLIAARLVSPRGQVFAFEPDPFMHRYLRSNVELNQLRNVHCLKAAASNSVGQVRFVRDELERGHLTSSEEHRPLAVWATTLDAFFNNLGWPAIDLIKMDIEGAETAALQGMTELVRRNSRLRLIVEFNIEAIRRSGSSPAGFAEAMRRMGFERAYVIENHMKELSLASPPSSHFLFNLFVTR